jgi:MarR family transcriptional regulator for hemolysin
MSNPAEASSKTSIHKSVGYWAGLLSRSMEAEFNRRLAPHGLTRMSYAVLGAMVFDGCTKPSEVADFLHVDRGAVTRLMDKLAEQDLIERSTGTSDRRSVSITVKPEGVALAKELKGHSRAVNELFTANLKSGESDRFIDLVKTMLANSEVSPKSL